jgi:hypothetical protein
MSLSCWYCGFEYHRGHGCLSVASVVCCQAETSATGRFLVQRSPTECSCVRHLVWSDYTIILYTYKESVDEVGLKPLFLYLYCPFRCVISKFSRCTQSKTTRQIFIKKHTTSATCFGSYYSHLQALREHSNEHWSLRLGVGDTWCLVLFFILRCANFWLTLSLPVLITRLKRCSLKWVNVSAEPCGCILNRLLLSRISHILLWPQM